jgi:hypothetical protein
LPNVGNAVSYCYVVKLCATSKRGIFNGFNAVRYGYAGKAGVTKSANTNACYVVRYGYVAKAGTVTKNGLPNTGNAASYCYAGEVRASVKCTLPKAGNAIRYSVTVFLCFLISMLFYL